MFKSQFRSCRKAGQIHKLQKGKTGRSLEYQRENTNHLERKSATEIIPLPFRYLASYLFSALYRKVAEVAELRGVLAEIFRCRSLG